MLEWRQAVDDRSSSKMHSALGVTPAVPAHFQRTHVKSRSNLRFPLFRQGTAALQ